MSIQNVGNTCYLSAMLQCLIHTKTLNMYVNVIRNCKENVFHSYVDIHKRIQNNENGVMPTKFIDQLGETNKMFKSGQQEDAHEAMLSLLNILRKYTPLHLSLYSFSKHGKVAWNRDKMHNVIDEIFKLQHYSVLTCAHCNKCIRRQYTNEFGLIVYLCNNDDIVNVINNEYNNEESFEATCDTCNQKRVFLNKKQISHYPLSLIVCVGQKQLHLDTQQIFKPRINLQENEYDLYAVCKHHGSTINSGHYTACVKSNNRWYMKNDSMSYDLQIIHRSVMNIQKDGYIFIYHKTRY